mgnify:CR=1 FL=1|tara:strand:- start:2465 stop:3544 length:1080 start_codon:yes stop_codon:yes gene_type:complete
MGRVLVKSTLPSKVLVKFDDDYEYAYDANNNIVLVQSPKSRGRPTTRGERVASVVGNVAGAGRSLLQPANTFSQFLSNLRTGAQLGGQDLRGLYRNFLETRGARRRAENRQAVADRNERQDELFRQAVRSGQIQMEGPRFGGTSRQQRQNALAELRAAQDTAGQRERDMQEVGREIFERQARISGTGIEGVTLADAQQYMANQNALVQAGAQLGNRIDVPTVALPPPTEQETRDLLADLQRATAPRPVGPARDIMPQEEDVNVTKRPRGNTVRVVNAAGTEISSDANAIAAQQPGVREAPKQGYTSALNEEINSTPAPNTTVPITKPKEEKPAEQEEEPSMLRMGIENKLRNFESEVEA